jgi:hypothetical protein
MTWLGRVVLPLRILLVVLFLILVVFQTFSFPGQFAYLAEQDPGSAHLRWPLTAFAAVEILCVQVVLVCTWRLLSLVEHDRIFSEGAFVWVDLIVGALAVAWVLFAGFAACVGRPPDDPGAPLVLFALLLVGGVVGLLVVVMRTLLRQATVLRTDLDGVI